VVSNWRSFLVRRQGRGQSPAFLLSLGCLTGLIVACHGGVLFGGRQFGFRDAARFYYPLYSRVQQEWSAGRLPLWEPGENGGTPMLGSPMAAVLYPGKILFALVPYAWGVRLYTVAHEVLAFFAMAALVRSWGISATGAALAGLSYAFGGPVLSNYFNIIYLVGAAWAPLGFRAADRWLRLGRRWALVELALVLAMQVLGGDPEAAYLTVLCALGYAVGLARSVSAAPARPWLWGLGLVTVAAGWIWVGPQLASWLHGSDLRWGQAILTTAWGFCTLAYLASRRRAERDCLGSMLLGLALAAALALLLAAVQVLPVLESFKTSVRWAGTGPEDLYDSSLLPYRACEWLWPNVFGTFSHGHHYWISLLPPVEAQRPWPLSLYLGALPLVLALGAAGFRQGPPWRGWMTAVALVSFWASLGEFAGLARWTVAVPSATTGDDSLYGLLATLSPGFRLFRMPFKLLVFTTIALTALAGAGWDQLATATGRRRVVAITIGLVVLTAAVATTAAVMRHRLAAMMAAAPESRHGVFGPLDAPAAVGELLRGLGHGVIALATSLAVVAWSARRPRPAGLVALAVLTADLAVAQAPLVVAIPQADFERESAVVRAIRAAEAGDPSPGPFRVHRLPAWVPTGWTQVASTHRLRELVDWEIDTLQPAFGLLQGVSYVWTDESQTGRAEFRRLFQPNERVADAKAAARLGVEPGRRVLDYPRRAFDLWGARYFIMPAYPGDWTTENRGFAAFLDRTELVYPDPAELAGPAHSRDRRQWLLEKDVQVRRNKAVFPRAWVVHEARPIQPLDGSQPGSGDALRARLRRGDSPTQADDLRSIAYVETDRPESLAPFRPGGPTDPAETVTVRYDSPIHVVLQARLRRPGILVLADVFDPGWHLTIDGRPAPIFRANLLMRAATVAAGPHTLVYRYEPASVRLGAWGSLSGLAALAGLALLAYHRPLAWHRPWTISLGAE